MFFGFLFLFFVFCFLFFVFCFLFFVFCFFFFWEKGGLTNCLEDNPTNKKDFMGIMIFSGRDES